MNKLLSILACAALMAACVQSAAARTVLFDFEFDAQGWGSFGAITTDSGPQFEGSDGIGRYHAGDFSQPDEGNFGIVDVSPLGLDLATFSGISVDARFVDPPGVDPFIGARELDIVVATGEDADEEEFFAPKVTMSEAYQTFAIPFSNFTSTLDGGTPTLADLSDIRIKLVFFNTNGTGHGRLDYDQVTGLAPVTADFNGDGDVDGDDFLAWQRGIGVGSTPTEGDANASGSVDAADFAVWKSQFGTVDAAAGAGLAAPEPAAFIIAFIAMASLAGRFRRTSRPQSAKWATLR